MARPGPESVDTVQAPNFRQGRKSVTRNMFTDWSRRAPVTALDDPGSQSLAESFEPSLDPLAVHAEVALPINGATVNGERGF